jgi:hypothetical protein
MGERITVALADKRELKAEVVARDLAEIVLAPRGTATR